MSVQGTRALLCEPQNDALNARWRRYTPGGIIEAAFYIQVFGAIFSPVVQLFNSLRLISYHFRLRHVCSMAYREHVQRLQPFPLHVRYAIVLKTVALAVLYAPVLPISPGIGFLGVALGYAVDQYLALRVYEKPKARAALSRGGLRTGRQATHTRADRAQCTGAEQ